MSHQARRIEKEINRTVRDVVRTVQIRSYQAISTGTPVDTGFARGQWTPSLDAPVAKAAIPPKDKNEARIKGAQDFAENRGRAQRLASSYQLSQGPVFLTNTTPYIEKLNEGSSAQAPAKFVEKAILEAIRKTVATFNAR